MSGLSGVQLLVYIDDLLIWSFSFEEHLRHLDIVFSTAAKYGMKLKLEK